AGVRIAGMLYWFWMVRGIAEGRRWLARLLAIAPVGPPDEARARALVAAGVLAMQNDDHTAAQGYVERGLEASRAVGFVPGMPEALQNLGDIARSRGALPAAAALYEQGLAVRREGPDKGAMAVTLHGLGRVASEMGDFAAARRWLDESEA